MIYAGNYLWDAAVFTLFRIRKEYWHWNRAFQKFQIFFSIVIFSLITKWNSHVGYVTSLPKSHVLYCNLTCNWSNWDIEVQSIITALSNSSLFLSIKFPPNFMNSNIGKNTNSNYYSLYTYKYYKFLLLRNKVQIIMSLCNNLTKLVIK